MAADRIAPNTDLPSPEAARRHAMTNANDAAPADAAPPHRCPVCTGLGHVAGGWYTSQPGCSWMSASCGTEPCRSCGGTGIIWANRTPPESAPGGRADSGTDEQRIADAARDIIDRATDAVAHARQFGQAETEAVLARHFGGRADADVGLDLEPIRKRCKEASAVGASWIAHEMGGTIYIGPPKPWSESDVYDVRATVDCDEGYTAKVKRQCRADAEFIAHAREDVPALLRAVAEIAFVNQQLTAEIERLRALGAPRTTP